MVGTSGRSPDEPMQFEATINMFLSTVESPAERGAKTVPAGELSLVAAVRDGDREAFEKLYSQYSPMVHGVLLARVPRDEVDDLVQDVFLIALRKLHSLRDEAALGGWLATIARNRAVDFYRQRPQTEDLNEDIPDAASTEEATEAARALAAVKSLPEAYRETLILRLVEGMTGPEIAERTGLTPASVRVNLHRGMKLLREKLGISE
jgi:RNA polymerase sigma-70 factor (ECF subfamily)